MTSVAEHDEGVVLPLCLNSHAGLSGLARRLLWLPVWLQALVVYVPSRVISLGIMGAVVRTQPDNPWMTGSKTSLLDFLNFWDAGWYERIATDGYPSTLPYYESGALAQNQWAFYPLHPLLTKWAAQLTGLSYQQVSPALSTLFAAGAAIVILYLFRLHATPSQALTGLTFVFVFPASPVFNTGYSESLTFLLLALSLLLVVQRRYLLAIPAVFLLDLARPIGVAFAFFMLAHLVARFVRRSREPYPNRQILTSWTLGVLSCVAALVHPAAAWIVTGNPSAYTETEAAWTGKTRILMQWVDAATGLAGAWGVLLLVAVVVALTAVVLSPGGRLMGLALQQFTLAYGVYLLLFFTPQTSTLRLMIPMFGLSMALARTRSWTARIVVIVMAIVLQIVWVSYLWHFTPPGDLPP